MLEWIINKLGQKMPSTGYKSPSAPAQQRPAISFGFVANSTPSGSSGRSQFVAIGNIEAICPYCGSRLDKKPGRKKECPKCSNFIYVRTRPLDNQKVLVTDEQKEVIEEQWSIVNGSHEAYLAERHTREEKRVNLARQFGQESSDNEIHWSSLGSDTNCPYCGKVVVPKPVRHRKCPQCGQPIRVRHSRLLTEALEKQLNEKIKRQRGVMEQEKRLRMKGLTRESNLRTLQAARDLQRECPGGFGVEVQAMLDDETCEYCANRDGTIIRADQCTPESIPPWPQCTSESGCRCYLLTAMGLDMPEGNGETECHR